MVTKILTELKNPSIGTQIYDYINLAQEWLDEMGYWHHLTSKVPYQMLLVAPYTTGTASVTLGSTTVTGSGTTFTSAHVNQVIRFSGNDEHYYITAVASATSLTLNVAYNGATAAAATLAIHTINYDLPSTISLRKIRSAVIQNPYRKLVYVDQRRRDEMSPDPISESAQPWAYLDWGQSTIQPYPATDAAYVVTVRFQKKPTAVSASQTTLDWPDQMHFAIYKLALAQGWKFMDDDQAAEVLAEGMAMGQAAFDRQKKNGDHDQKLRAFDEYANKGVFGLRLGTRING